MVTLKSGKTRVSCVNPLREVINAKTAPPAEAIPLTAIPPHKGPQLMAPFEVIVATDEAPSQPPLDQILPSGPRVKLSKMKLFAAPEYSTTWNGRVNGGTILATTNRLGWLNQIAPSAPTAIDVGSSVRRRLLMAPEGVIRPTAGVCDAS